MNIEASLLSVAVGIIIPGLIALIAKEHASDALKSFLTALLTAASGGLSGALMTLPRGWHSWEAILWQIFLAWTAAAVAYFTGWKPSGIAAKITAATSDFGLPPGPARPADPAVRPADAGFVAVGMSLLLAFTLCLVVIPWLMVAAVIILFSVAAVRVGLERRAPLRR